ncbi:hypothetical protein CKF54_07610 [Psittacicella hinzii]|uniref:Alanine racemase N-terminal domain-containing protein n=1 Tax=Psittacicella hinzii TaxID=2028575 RepID=A0A3A1XYQ5_9GAMM|nr:alanine racemase [Psittacicella hinzii]RIY31103.1 hypothetical protein CKF54_07610 [Psittacicella hinzii]
MKRNLQEINNTLKSLVDRKVELMVVSKYVSTESLFATIVLGNYLVGENYVQEAKRKFTSLSLIKDLVANKSLLEEFLEGNLNAIATNGLSYDEEVWNDILFLRNYKNLLQDNDFYQELKGNLSKVKLYIIGNVQSRKLKEVCSFADGIASISTEKSILKANTYATDSKRKLDILLQLKSPLVNQDNRAGASEEEIYNLAKQLKSLDNLKLKGLMFIASTDNKVEEYEFAQKVHQKLLEIEPNATTLSMGMSDSLEISLKYGSTQVRIGSAIFKE